MATQSQKGDVRMPGAETERLGRSDLRTGLTQLVSLAWGLGDVLLSTSAVREYKRLHPDVTIVYRTYKIGARRALTYKMGAPSQMLEHNPDIDVVVDWDDDLTRFLDSGPNLKPVDFHYAGFGGPPLDYPIQAHYWENLGLTWEPGQRFDSHYFVTDAERAWARNLIGKGPHLVLTPGGGWPGKMWTPTSWMRILRWALDHHIRPIIVDGGPTEAPGWHARGVVNLAGRTDIRQAGAILAEASHALMTEGGMSNLRFAVGKPVVLLTCATQIGVTLWAPPELLTEVRVREKDGWPACQPCMWRGEHVKRRRADVPPATLKGCPEGRSLRDITPAQVIKILEEVFE